MRNPFSFAATITLTYICFSTVSVKAILPDSSEYKQAQLSAKTSLKTCRTNKGIKINSECVLFYAISDENSEVYKLVDGNWQANRLRMFDNPIFGKVSLIQVVKFDREWAYGFTYNETPGKKLFRLRMSTIHYNYGC